MSVYRFLTRTLYDNRIVFLIILLVFIQIFFIFYINISLSEFFISGVSAEACGTDGSGGLNYVRFVFDFISVYFRMSVVLFLAAMSLVFSLLFYDSLDKKYFVYEFFGQYSTSGLLLRVLMAGLITLFAVSLLFVSLWLPVFTVLFSGYDVMAWYTRIVLGFVALVVGISLLSAGLGGSVAGAMVVGAFSSILFFFVPTGKGYSGLLDLYALGLDRLGPEGLMALQSVGVYPLWALILVLLAGAVVAGLRVVFYEW